MDERKFEKSGQNVLDFKCKKILHGEEKSASLSAPFVQKQGIVGDQNLEINIATQTPEKTNESLHTKPKKKEVKHLEKYNAMVELFDSMTCSLRLLSLCKKPSTFQNISTQVEVLTKRKFLQEHLAQIKYLFPEAIQIDNILAHDKKTLCMEPDMRIALLFDVIEGHCQHSDFIALSQVFASRLINYFTMNPEAYDIPEATLPEPFSQRHGASLENKATEVPEALGLICGKSQSIALDQSLVGSSESMPITTETEVLSTSSLLHPSFRRCFSGRSLVPEIEKANISKSPLSVLSATSDNLNNPGVKTMQSEECPGEYLINEDTKANQWTPDTCSKSIIDNSPFQMISPQCLLTFHACKSPLQKPALPAGSLMLGTPAQVTPRRSLPSCDNKFKDMTVKNSASCCKPPRRTLEFSHLEGDRNALDSARMVTNNYNVLQDDINQALEVETKEFSVEGNVIVSPILLKRLEESHSHLPLDCEKSKPVLATDQHISGCLADLVALIYHILESVNCSSITKQELVHKIIMNNLDIVEKRDVEEQIEQLEKLVPDWICRKLAPGGDIMYNIKKVMDLASVQARLY